MDYRERREVGEKKLIENLKSNLPALEALLERTDDHWAIEDLVYRYYHHSYKVFHAQNYTEGIVRALRELNPFPEEPLNVSFTEIVSAGTRRSFTGSTNANWDAETRPILEALFHARYFLAMAVKYGKLLESGPQILPSGWAAVLHLYGIR